MMSKETENQLDGSMHLSQRLPLAWRLSEVDSLEVASIMCDNEALLGNQNWLEEFEHGLYDEVSRSDHEDAIEVRLDLLVALVGMWMRRQSSPPPRVLVTLSETTLSWESARPPGQGERLLVDLYLVPRFPMAMVLPCEVLEVSRSADGDGWWAKARLLHLSERTRQGISRAVFRYHRRLLRERRAHLGEEKPGTEES